MKSITTLIHIKSLVSGAALVAALLVSAHSASADEDYGLGCGFVSTGIRVSAVGEEYDCSEGLYLAENAGGTITIQVDLPSGTFDLGGTPGPGDIFGPGPTLAYSDGTSSISPDGITGPATVYISFLNAGAAITRAAAVSVSGTLPDSSTVEDDVDLSCGFTSTGTRISAVGDEYDCSEGVYLAENGGGTITIQVDLPAGTFDIGGTPGPGDIFGPGPTVAYSDGTESIDPDGITGPTTVYVSFLNAGAAITRAAGVSVDSE